MPWACCEIAFMKVTRDGRCWMFTTPGVLRDRRLARHEDLHHSIGLAIAESTVDCSWEDENGAKVLCWGYKMRQLAEDAKCRQA
jgi:hypothetical protein